MGVNAEEDARQASLMQRGNAARLGSGCGPCCVCESGGPCHGPDQSTPECCCAAHLQKLCDQLGHHLDSRFSRVPRQHTYACQQNRMHMGGTASRYQLLPGEANSTASGAWSRNRRRTIYATGGMLSRCQARPRSRPAFCVRQGAFQAPAPSTKAQRLGGDAKMQTALPSLVLLLNAPRRACELCSATQPHLRHGACIWPGCRCPAESNAGAYAESTGSVKNSIDFHDMAARHPVLVAPDGRRRPPRPTQDHGPPRRLLHWARCDALRFCVPGATALEAAARLGLLREAACRTHTC